MIPSISDSLRSDAPDCFPTRWLLGCLLVLLWSASPLSAKDTNSIARRDYPSFKLISERNIFNSNRTRRSSRGGAETRKAARIETVTLVGTMSYEKGLYAFFDGSSSELKKALGPGQSIAGFKVAQITSTSVRLEAENKTLDLQVGTQLRREDEGEWQVASTPAAATSATSASSDSPGDESDVIKRLMQQREQELK